MKQFLIDQLARLDSYMVYGLHGGFGAGANYLYYHASKRHPFALLSLVSFMLLGAVATNIFGPMLPADMLGRDGLLIAIGFCFWPILAALDARGGWLAKRLTTFQGK